MPRKNGRAAPRQPAPPKSGRKGHDLDADLSMDKRGNAVVKDSREDDENSPHDRAERIEGDDEDTHG